jgi:hypothetical protein
MVYEAGVAVHAGDTGTSGADAWSGARSDRGRTPVYGAGIRGERAMASDSERPSREGGESRRE